MNKTAILHLIKGILLILTMKQIIWLLNKIIKEDLLMKFVSHVELTYNRSSRGSPSFRVTCARVACKGLTITTLKLKLLSGLIHNMQPTDSGKLSQTQRQRNISNSILNVQSYLVNWKPWVQIAKKIWEDQLASKWLSTHNMVNYRAFNFSSLPTITDLHNMYAWRVRMN